ncbi:MAG: A/G-specific adenine glycosylase [Bryobacteraceae bacterium]
MTKSKKAGPAAVVRNVVMRADTNPSPGNASRFRRALLSWYGRNKRDLPWRRTRDPYAIWLSEIMLQQTRVAAVLEHYRAFLKLFPDISALAAASEDAVLAAWSGLGYYRRARMLRECAREMLKEHGGRFPQTADALLQLPGIGRYTAAAIASIAFGEPSAVVDGNVDRVLQRIVGRSLEAAESWKRAQDLLSPSRPGDFNQAMMELGATVCLPRDPLCAACPVRSLCATRAREMVEKGSGFGALQSAAPARQIKREIWCALERRDGQVRLVKRPRSASLMAGMWELPQWGELPHKSAQSAKWRTFRHSITVTDYTVHVLRDWKKKPPFQGIGSRGPGVSAGRGAWVAIETIPRLPITGLTRKILRADGII